ncbi:MAG: ABC transporter permease subunit [Anaerolineales bacterium]
MVTDDIRLAAEPQFRVKKSSKRALYFAENWPLYAMMLPGMVLLFLFRYLPAYGIAVAFERFNPALGVMKSQWIGLDNFVHLVKLPEFWRITYNTFFIAIVKVVTLQFFAIVFSISLNEVGSHYFKRGIQTIVYLPHFLSWVVLGGLMLDLLSNNGLVNTLLRNSGNLPIIFLGSNDWFRPTLVLTYLWQEVGWAAIIYLAALTAIDPTLYEAAAIDGASPWQRIRYVTLPGIQTTVILIGILSLGNVVDAGFDQVLNLYNPSVYRTGDILDTFVYRSGIQSAQFGLATAVGLFKSVARLGLVAIGYWLASKRGDFQIF